MDGVPTRYMDLAGLHVGDVEPKEHTAAELDDELEAVCPEAFRTTGNRADGGG